MSKRSQPAWNAPGGSYTTGLKLYNSLTRQKDYFVPQNGRKVLWYSCGPTVYDSSHMGHARCYISNDILRRVLRDYFHYDVLYAMNITDIDDKIIKRARQKHLMNEYVKKSPKLDALLGDITEAMQPFLKKLEDETDLDKKAMYLRTKEKVESGISNTNAQRKNAGNDMDAQTQLRDQLLLSVQDLLPDWLDAQYGATVTDNSIFAELPHHYEAEYHEDMEACNVLPPDVLTRVSEYVPEVVQFVEKIISNGFAYASQGSVYFDTNKFATNDKHFYAKLVPEAFGDEKALHEGEGDLSISSDRLNEKHSPNDFALWKASKAGEPAWDSPWGKGRPGWHIECSAMASCILGESMDIHSGGVDLKFPHHDNELAQSEAHYGNSNWVHYFLHSGHLHIDGCKMSKSLKNFISIRQALQKHTARQLRFAFLLHSWKDTLDYSANTMSAALNFEKLSLEFFLNVKDWLRRMPASGPASFTKWSSEELNLNENYQKCQDGVHTALCDSVDTRTALDCMRDLITDTNKYLDVRRRADGLPDRGLLRNISVYITKILRIFGAIDEKEEEFGYPSAGTHGTVDAEAIAMPYLTAFSQFREDVRQVARREKIGDILRQCDAVRDDVLPELGVRLEDHEGTLPSIKLVDKETLMRERAEKREQEEIKNQEREKKAAQKAREQAEKDAKNSISPCDMFRSEADKYSKFDDKGLPTHDAAGNELTKSQQKKLVKLYEAQLKKYNEYKTRTESNNTNSIQPSKSEKKCSSKPDVKPVLTNGVLDIDNSSNPICRFVNVELCNRAPSSSATSNTATILLENPSNSFGLDMSSLKRHIQTVFELHGSRVELFLEKDQSKSVGNVDLFSLHGKMLYVYVQ